MKWTEPYYGTTHLHGLREGFYGGVTQMNDLYHAYLVRTSEDCDYCTSEEFREETPARAYVEEQAARRGAFPDV